MKPRRSVFLAHWREEEGRGRARELEDLGFRVRFEPVDAGGMLQILKTEKPGALVVDLSRSPAQGRDLGVALRLHRGTRRVPLVFAGGTPAAVKTVRQTLPDAVFASWDEIVGPLTEAMENPLVNPVVPSSALAGYSGTPLPRKLGIKSGTRVLLSGAPEDFPETLGDLPEGSRLLRRFVKDVDLILWFVRSERELNTGIGKWVRRTGPGGIWIAWPKKASDLPSDLTQAIVRRVGLASGLVDYKIAAIDATWSGLKFALRKRKKG
jgi:hypothetical protein